MVATRGRHQSVGLAAVHDVAASDWTISGRRHGDDAPPRRTAIPEDGSRSAACRLMPTRRCRHHDHAGRRTSTAAEAGGRAVTSGSASDEAARVLTPAKIRRRAGATAHEGLVKAVAKVLGHEGVDDRVDAAIRV